MVVPQHVPPLVRLRAVCVAPGPARALRSPYRWALDRFRARVEPLDSGRRPTADPLLRQPPQLGRRTPLLLRCLSSSCRPDWSRGPCRRPRPGLHACHHPALVCGSPHRGRGTASTSGGPMRPEPANALRGQPHGGAAADAGPASSDLPHGRPACRKARGLPPGALLRREPISRLSDRSSETCTAPRPRLRSRGPGAMALRTSPQLPGGLGLHSGTWLRRRRFLARNAARRPNCASCTEPPASSCSASICPMWPPKAPSPSPTRQPPPHCWSPASCSATGSAGWPHCRFCFSASASSFSTTSGSSIPPAASSPSSDSACCSSAPPGSTPASKSRSAAISSPPAQERRQAASGSPAPRKPSANRKLCLIRSRRTRTDTGLMPRRGAISLLDQPSR